MDGEHLQKLLNYLHDLPELDLHQSKDEFIFYSYAHSAVEEVIQRVLDCPFEATDDILWKFILEMSHYANKAQTEDVKFLYETLCEVGVDLVYVLHN